MKTIVLLSTNEPILRTLEEKLADLDFNVKAINNYDDIFGYIRVHKPDLLLIDFILREGNGGSICHQIKCDPQTNNLPVILFSEHEELLPFLKKFGCDDSIAKPFDLLHTKINACLNRGNGPANKQKEKRKTDKNIDPGYSVTR